MLLRLMYGVRTAEAMLATTMINQIRMAEMFAKIISEHSGILCAAAILSCGRITGVHISSANGEVKPGYILQCCSRHLQMLGIATLHIPAHCSRQVQIHETWHGNTDLREDLCACIAGEPGIPPDHRAIWLQALVQILTSLGTDFVCMAAEWKYHRIDNFSCWVKDMRRFIWYLLVIVTIGGSR